MAATYSSLDIRLRSLWAKSGDTSWHSLLAHMLDVAASAEVLLERESGAACLSGGTGVWSAPPKGRAMDRRHSRASRLRQEYSRFSGEMASREGKCRVGRATVQCGLSKFDNHAGASAALLLDILPTVGIPPTWAHGVLQAISAHHGYNFNAREIRSPNPHIEGYFPPGGLLARCCLVLIGQRWLPKDRRLLMSCTLLLSSGSLV